MDEQIIDEQQADELPIDPQVEAEIMSTIDPASLLDVRTIEQLQAEFDKTYLLADRLVIKAVAGFVIANKNGRDPLWLFLVGPSSGGKTEIINALEGLNWVHPIDTLTVNTFASGQKRAGKETSLLMRIKTGILTFKDFTSILEMNKDARKEIMSQLRGIFDGTFVKRTGTGDDIKWAGKLGLIAAVTSVIHQKQAEFSSMGERFIQYAIVQPDRKDVQRRIFANSFSMSAKRDHLRICFASFINNVLAATQDEDIEISEDIREEIIVLADFCTKARSGLIQNERTGKVDFIPDSEMPTRVTSQLITMASGLMTLNKAHPVHHDAILLQEDKDIIYKISLDSVPRKRRQCLQLMARYKSGVTAAACGTELNYDTEVIKLTLQELCALQLAKRVSRNDTYYYVLLDEFRPVMERFEAITPLDQELSATDVAEDTTDRDKAIDDAFNITTQAFFKDDE